jgi:hypothetical protein
MAEGIWLGPTILLLIYLYLFIKKKKQRMAEELSSKPTATVSSIFIYPIKSCRGISVPQAPITPTGKTDRIHFFILFL